MVRILEPWKVVTLIALLIARIATGMVAWCLHTCDRMYYVYGVPWYFMGLDLVSVNLHSTGSVSSQYTDCEQRCMAPPGLCTIDSLPRQLSIDSYINTFTFSGATTPSPPLLSRGARPRRPRRVPLEAPGWRPVFVRLFGFNRPDKLISGHVSESIG